MIKRLSKLIYQSNSIKQAVGILFVTVLLSNVLGLVRNVIIANRAGLTYGSIGPLDSYYAAFVLPDLIYNIVIVGALSSAVLPLLAKIDSDRDEQLFWRTFNTLLSTGLVAITLCLIILYFLMPSLLRGLLPGFGANSVELTIKLARVMILSPLFFTVSQITSSALQAKKMFFAPALAPIIYNLAIIFAALLIPTYGLDILAFGVILGATGHFLVQLPALIGLGWRWRFFSGWKDSKTQQVVRLMLPRAIALTGNQLLLISFYRLSSHLNSGSISIYRLTDDLQTAPVLLLANTLAMAVLPDFVRHLAKDNHEDFHNLIGKSIRLMFFLFLPLSIFFVIYRQPIIDLYISIGHSIDPGEVHIAATTFALFVWSFFFQGLVLILARAYFARQNTVVPTTFSLISVFVSYFTAVSLLKYTNLGVSGLALAFSLGSTLNAVLLWIGLKIPLEFLWSDGENRHNFFKIAGGAAISGVVFLIFHQLSHGIRSVFLVGQSGANLLEIVIGLALGLAFYAAWCQVFKVESWQLIKPIKRDSTTKSTE